MNNNEAQIGSLVNLNNSMEKNKEKSGIKYNLTLIKNNNNNNNNGKKGATINFSTSII